MAMTAEELRDFKADAEKRLGFAEDHLRNAKSEFEAIMRGLQPDSTLYIMISRHICREIDVLLGKNGGKFSSLAVKALLDTMRQ